uniref:ribosomal protein L16 n=1 Tax=Euplotes cristatus TaxID=756077 RepID=UPI002E78FDCD|nr:ribosomal protein L16 [Euplotes cristatus]UPM52066.1 ribosomal protein L16 [Euplotes cristatus]
MLHNRWLASKLKTCYSPTRPRTNNLNIRRNWAQRLQKRVVFFPKFRLPPVGRTRSSDTLRCFGNSVFYFAQPLLLKALFLIRFELLLKRVVRKKDKTLRRYWITTRVLFNLTRQSKGARMGKGKGKNVQVFQLITPLSCFVGFRGVRLGRLLFFLRFFNMRFAGAIFLQIHWTAGINHKAPALFRAA